MRTEEITLAIDPGIRTIGACLFDGERPFAAMSVKRLKSTGDRAADVRSLVQKVIRWKNAMEPVPYLDRVVCELPQNFGSPVGRAAAARGDVVWMAFCVGFVAATAAATNAEFRAVEVNEWKGNMSKDLTARRVRRKLDRLGVEWRLLLSRDVSHDWDACGIGLHSLGLEL